MFILQQKTNGNKKTRRCNKARFKILKRKLSFRGSLLLVPIQFWGGGKGEGGGDERLFEFEREGGGWGGNWCLFETGRLLTFFAFRMDAYSR